MKNNYDYKLTLHFGADNNTAHLNYTRVNEVLSDSEYTGDYIREARYRYFFRLFINVYSFWIGESEFEGRFLARNLFFCFGIFGCCIAALKF